MELLKWASLGYALSILTRYKITRERLARNKYFIAYHKHLNITVVKSFITLGPALEHQVYVEAGRTRNR